MPFVRCWVRHATPIHAGIQVLSIVTSTTQKVVNHGEGAVAERARGAPLFTPTTPTGTMRHLPRPEQETGVASRCDFPIRVL